MSNPNENEAPDGQSPPTSESFVLASGELSAAERDFARLLGQLLAEMWDAELGAKESSSISKECGLTVSIRSSEA